MTDMATLLWIAVAALSGFVLLRIVRKSKAYQGEQKVHGWLPDSDSSPGTSLSSAASIAMPDGWKSDAFQFDDAYRSSFDLVVKEITGEAIDLAPLMKVREEILGLNGNPAEQAKIIMQALAGQAWDWPRYASHEMGETIIQICAAFSSMPVDEVLSFCTVAELKTLCSLHGLARGARKKEEFVQALLKADQSVWGPLMTETLSAKREMSLHRCRKKMAKMLTCRVSAVAYNQWRVKELIGLAEHGYLTHWRLHRPELDGPVAECGWKTDACLHFKQAIHEFPELPCASLRCDCRIVALSPREARKIGLGKKSANL